MRVYFNHKCTDVDLDSATAHLETTPVAAGVSPANSENQIISAHGDAVIGVDGAFSAVRQSMQMQINRFEHDESYLAAWLQRIDDPARARMVRGEWRRTRSISGRGKVS